MSKFVRIIKRAMQNKKDTTTRRIYSIHIVLTLAVQVMLSWEIITALGGPVVPAKRGQEQVGEERRRQCKNSENMARQEKARKEK